MNGINIVVAENFARIFRQNMYNCGMIAAELDSGVIDELFREFANTDTLLIVDIKKSILVFLGGGKQKIVGFTLTGFERDLVESGGWLEYADKRY
jgi:3-isopropylmalate/(R)-2-methylmalate dehydratase small subunit